MFQPRTMTHDEFMDFTVMEYRKDYNLTMEQARTAAQQEWDIRQEVETKYPSLKRGKQVSKSSTQGFGQNRLGPLSIKEEKVYHTAGEIIFKIDPTVLEYARTGNKRYLSTQDIDALFCGDRRFLIEYARLTDFPKFSPRNKGFARWMVGEWITRFRRHKQVKIKIK